MAFFTPLKYIGLGATIIGSLMLIQINSGEEIPKKVSAIEINKMEETVVREQEEAQKISMIKELTNKRKEKARIELEAKKEKIFHLLSQQEKITEEEKVSYSNKIKEEEFIGKLDTIKNEFIQLQKEREEADRIKEEKRIAEEKRKEEAVTTTTTSVQHNVEVPQTTSSATTQSVPVTTDYSSYQPTVVLANGNTAGNIGAYAAKRMEALTGVSYITWENIIARESNGNLNAHNPSGAHGLFQTMEQIWGRSNEVEGQISIALYAYNEALRVFGNGLQPWGM